VADPPAAPAPRLRPSFRAFSRNGTKHADVLFIEERDPSRPDPAYPQCPGPVTRCTSAALSLACGECAPGARWCERTR
jgi:hypothetical protein